MILNEVAIDDVGVVIPVDCIEHSEDLRAQKFVVSIHDDAYLLLQALVVDGVQSTLQEVLLLCVPYELNFLICVFLLDVGFDGLDLVGCETISHVDYDKVCVFLVEDRVEHVFVRVWLLVGVGVDNGADGQFFVVLAQLVLLLEPIFLLLQECLLLLWIDGWEVQVELGQFQVLEVFDLLLAFEEFSPSLMQFGLLSILILLPDFLLLGGRLEILAIIK